ncbi:MAG: hypothetical protein WDN28_18915 [Chthoniobacter sp.]
MKEEFVTLAHQLGFDLCRTTACVTPPHAAEFRAWLAEGRAGDMAWLERNEQRRTDPQQVLRRGAQYRRAGDELLDGERCGNESRGARTHRAIRLGRRLS